MSELTAFTAKLSKLESKMNRRTAIPQTIASEFADELRSNLPVMGNDYAKGEGNDTGYVSSKAAQGKATISWTGQQIWYIEFGTGSPAVGKYPDQAQMTDAGTYAPRATGHSLGAYWTLPMEEFSDADGKPIVTKGWAPYAPFYKTQMAFKSGKFDSAVEKTVHDLVKEFL